MILERGLGERSGDRNAAVTVGSFDGVHLGHRALLDRLIQRAAASGLVSTVVTFDPHPRSVLSGQPMKLLTTITERAAALAEIGIERVVVIEFNQDFAELSSTRYISDILIDGIGMSEIVIGHDHAFGKDRTGNLQTLEKLATEFDFKVSAIVAQEATGTIVSSTAIRESLAAGNIERANDLLGRWYTIQGEVVKGKQLGRTIGFPTANVETTGSKVLPAHGVYAAFASLPDDDAHRIPAMINIGVRPTVDSDARVTVEAHMIDFDGDLYGRQLRLELVKRMRGERKFDGVSSLVAQLQRDQSEVRSVLDDFK